MRDPESVAALFAEIETRFGRLDVLFNNAGVSAPAVPLEDLTSSSGARSIDTNLTGAFLCTQDAFRMMKTAGAARRPDHQQRLDLGARAASAARPRTPPRSTPSRDLTSATSLDGRAYDIACGQIDIGNAATEMTERVRTTGALQPDSSTRIEPSLDVEHVARAVVYMAGLPLDANVQFMTVMATKMPYIGRG